MSLTLYTAPNCIRCKTVKNWLHDQNLEYTSIDFKENAHEFNAFYRAKRKEIYRGAEGVEFPLFDDGKEVKQGSGVILAYCIAEHALDGAIRRSDLWHGWISGLYPSLCADGQEDNFAQVLTYLKKGGLTTFVQVNGNKPKLLERLLNANLVDKVVLNIPGGADSYTKLGLHAPSVEDLAQSIALVRTTKDGQIRFFAEPLPEGDTWRWPDRNDALAAAAMVFQACQDHSLPYAISAATSEMPIDMHDLAPLEEALLLKYRSASRQHLFKADIAKD